MNTLSFPKAYKHEHPPIKDINEIIETKKTAGQKAADRIAAIMGSWKFLIIQSIVIVLWITVNIAAYINK
jgi:uncharacterized membrane protein